MTNNSLSDANKSPTLNAAWHAFNSGDLSSSKQLFEQFLLSTPNDPIGWTGLGMCLEKMLHYQAAANAYNRALTLEPRSFQAAHGLGRLLINLDRADEAIPVLLSSIEINPGSDAAWSDLGSAQLALNQLSNANQSFRHAVALNPRFLPAIVNLGACLREQGKTTEAVLAFESALDIDPNYSSAVTRLAVTLSDLGNIEQSLNVLDRYLETHPNDIQCHQNKALILLRSGSFKDGFLEYEWRLSPSPLGVEIRPFSLPRWQGDKLEERKLLIWLEQGIGDEILSLGLWDKALRDDIQNRYIIECDHRLAPLIQRSYPATKVVPRQDPPAPETKAADLVCPGWSIARFLGDDLSRSSSLPGYLSANHQASKILRSKYEQLAGGRTIVGLSWASGARSRNLKTPTLETWKLLLTNDTYFFVSLQHAPSHLDISALSEIAGREIYVDPVIDTTQNLDESAAQLAALDAAVTISNSTAHLAGALGIPVATVVPLGYGGFWYWHRDRSDSPWYPSMRVCRQKEPGHWPSAIAEACDWLKSSPWMLNTCHKGEHEV
jgi:tetratricopeptide (TPR) repeat protein